MPAAFNATCFRVGSHISCNLAFSDPDVIDEPSGIVCDGTELLASLSRSVVGTRLYDAQGDLLQRHFRESLDGTFTNPDTGLVALWTQHDTVIHNLSTPGDDTTGIEHVSEPPRHVRRLSSLRLQQMLGPGGERSERPRLRPA